MSSGGRAPSVAYPVVSPVPNGHTVEVGEPDRPWASPAEVAAGRYSLIPMDQWPMMAACWLVDGFDSPSLRELAALAASEGNRAGELMPDVLASLGHPLPVEEQFLLRCQAALDLVQRDLDSTGYSAYRMHPRNLLVSRFSFEMYAALPNGDSWSGGGVGGMTPDMDGNSLLWHAAASVSDTLTEVLWKSWPHCARHGGQPMAPPYLYEVPQGLIDGRGWWWCRAIGGHAVAPVGELTARTARASQIQGD